MKYVETSLANLIRTRGKKFSWDQTLGQYSTQYPTHTASQNLIDYKEKAQGREMTGTEVINH